MLTATFVSAEDVHGGLGDMVACLQVRNAALRDLEIERDNWCVVVLFNSSFFTNHTNKNTKGK